MNRFMLDTDLSIYVINHRPRAALDTFNAHAEEICISAITLAELLHGAEKSRDPIGTRRRVEDYTSRLNVLEALFTRLAATGARLIWAATTPVQTGTPKRMPADVVRYNGVAHAIASGRGVAVDDLYSLALPRLTALQPPRNVHFTAAGAEVLADQVAQSIREALRLTEPGPS